MELANLRVKTLVEYQTAARYAHECGRQDLIDCLLTMAEVEWEHERYFRERVLQSRWIRWLKIGPNHQQKNRYARRLAGSTDLSLCRFTLLLASKHRLESVPLS